MLWWIGAALVWLISATGIFFILADVFRGKSKVLAPKVLPWYAFHGVTAVIALWMVTKALGAGRPDVGPESTGSIGRMRNRSRPHSEDQEMKGVLKVSGYVLLVIGLIGIAWIVGDVLSRGTGINLLDLAPGLAFHTVCMVGGTALVTRGAAKTVVEAVPA